MKKIKRKLYYLKWKMGRFLWNIVNYCSRLRSIESNKIVIDNFAGKGFGDNPKYIVKWLLSNDNSFDIVWLVSKNMNTKLFPSGVRLVKYGSLRSAYELATAHIWVDNVKNNFKGKKRREQFYLQTWHGGIGFKKVEKAAEKTLNSKYIRASKNDSKQIDLMISNSNWVTNNYRNNFWYNGKIVKTGLPRNDIFFHNTEKVKQKVKNFYNIDQNTEILLYAPTFRNYISAREQVCICSFNEHKVIQTFEKKFGRKFILIKRMHPNVANEIQIIENNEVKNGSKYPDMQELLVATTALITDYSSCVFDFMLKSNKIFIFAKDYNQYIKEDREMEFNIKKDLPFMFSITEDELLANIKSFASQAAKKQLSSFTKQVALFEDGNASKRVANLLIKEINR